MAVESRSNRRAARMRSLRGLHAHTGNLGGLADAAAGAFLGSPVAASVTAQVAWSELSQLVFLNVARVRTLRTRRIIG